VVLPIAIRRRTPEERFENRVARAALALFSALICVIGLAMLTASATRGSGVFFVLLGGFFALRALRSSSVVVSESGISVRSILRTRRYEFSDLVGVEVVVGRTGFTGLGREHLVFHRANGQDVIFRELNCPPPRDASGSSVVRRAAASIRERLPRD
jgi:hypothetical protein